METERVAAVARAVAKAWVARAEVCEQILAGTGDLEALAACLEVANEECAAAEAAWRRATAGAEGGPHAA